ncbi:hypothetical protein Tco_0781284 [Tanacetum coccineum]
MACPYNKSHDEQNLCSLLYLINSMDSLNIIVDFLSMFYLRGVKDWYQELQIIHGPNLPPNNNEFAARLRQAAPPKNPDNMNGWLKRKDPEMEEDGGKIREEDPEMEKEEEEMEMEADEEWDGLEWILPYQGADPLYLANASPHYEADL